MNIKQLGLMVGSCILLSFPCREVYAVGDAPLLRIESGGHNGAVRHIALSSNGQTLVSVGDDKVARVWDLSTQRHQDIRYQIQPGAYQTLFSVAVASDPTHPLIAVGESEDAGRSADVILFDPSKPFAEQQVKRLPTRALGRPHPLYISDVEFSPDGERLVSASDVMQVWDIGSGKPIWEAQENDGNFAGSHLHRANTAAFSRDGALVAAGFENGKVQVWTAAGKKGRSITAKASVRNLAWSHDGKIAFGCSDGALYLWDPTSPAAPIPFPTHPDTITCVAFSPDDKYLLSGGGEQGKDFAIRVYEMATRRETQYARHKNTVFSIAVSPKDNQTVISADAAGQIYAWDLTTLQDRFALKGVGQIASSLAWSADGMRIAWNSQPNGPLDRAFHIGNAAPSYDMNPPGGWQSSGNALNGRKLIPSPDPTLLLVTDAAGKEIGRIKTRVPWDSVKCFAWLDDTHIVVGSDLYLAVYQLGMPNPIRLLEGHEGGITALSVSPKGPYLVTAGTDQTIRLWDLKRNGNTVTPLASLFYGRNNEWIFWVDEGYFACSPHGDRLIGWQVDQGLNRAAAFYHAEQFWQKFYRPDVMTRVVSAGQVSAAVQQADAVSHTHTDPAQVVANLAKNAPPQVAILSPQNGQMVNGDTVRVQARIVDPNNRKINRVLVAVNAARGRDLDFSVLAANADWAQDIHLQPGTNVITVVAVNDADAQSEPVDITVNYNSPAPEKPNLYLLAIGVSQYPVSSHVNALQYADKDALDFLQAYKAQEGLLFNKIVYSKTLTNEEATGDRIRQEFQTLAKQHVKLNDYVVVFLAGHGGAVDALNDNRNYCFLPVDAVRTDLSKTGLPGADILDAMGQITCNVILVMDTCRDGSGILRADDANLRQQFLAGKIKYGRMTFYSCQPTEKSTESNALQNGAFTRAFIDGISGGANARSANDITLADLETYLLNKVPELTQQAQHPALYIPDYITLMKNEFPIARKK